MHNLQIRLSTDIGTEKTYGKFQTYSKVNRQYTELP